MLSSSFFILTFLCWPVVDSDNHVFISTEGVSTLCPFTQTWNTKPRRMWHHYSSSVCCLSLCLFFILFPFLHVILFSLFLQNTILLVITRSSDIGLHVFAHPTSSVCSTFTLYLQCEHWLYKRWPFFDLNSHRGRSRKRTRDKTDTLLLNVNQQFSVLVVNVGEYKWTYSGRRVMMMMIEIYCNILALNFDKTLAFQVI